MNVGYNMHKDDEYHQNLVHLDDVPLDTDDSIKQVKYYSVKPG